MLSFLYACIFSLCNIHKLIICLLFCLICVHTDLQAGTDNKETDLKSVFSNLSPTVNKTFIKPSFSYTRQFIHSIQNRLMSARTIKKKPVCSSKMLLAFNGNETSQFTDSEVESPTFNTWAEGIGQRGTQKDLPGFSGYDYSMAGLTMGVDYSMVGFAMADHCITGLSIGYAATDIESTDDLNKSTIKHFSFSAYGSYELRDFYIEGVLSYGRNAYDNDLKIVMSQPVTEATNSHNGSVYSATASGGYYFRTGAWAFMPFTALSFTAVDDAGFETTDSGGYILQCNGRLNNSLTMDLGFKASRLVETGHYAFIPEVSLAWNYDFDIDDRNITVKIKEFQGPAFTIEEPETPEHGFITGAGLHATNGGAFITSIFYSGEYRKNYSAHGIMGKIQYMFD